MESKDSEQHIRFDQALQFLGSNRRTNFGKKFLLTIRQLFLDNASLLKQDLDSNSECLNYLDFGIEYAYYLKQDGMSIIERQDSKMKVERSCKKVKVEARADDAVG